MAVYFVEAIGPGLIKIGMATSVRKRVMTLAAASPVSLRLLAHMPGEKREEWNLHWHLRAHRHHGEWFSPHNDVLACVMAAKKHPQHLPHPPVEMYVAKDQALEYIVQRWKIEEGIALEILRHGRPIYSAIDHGNYAKADRLIKAAHLEILQDRDRLLGVPLEEFNALLSSSKFYDVRRRRATQWD